MEDHLLQRIKTLLLVCCGLGIAALAGWAGFAYQVSTAHRVSAEAAKLVSDRDAMKAKRDAALNKLEQLQQPPANLAQIDARLEALGAEYNRMWELAKVKRLEAAKTVEFYPDWYHSEGTAVNTCSLTPEEGWTVSPTGEPDTLRVAVRGSCSRAPVWPRGYGFAI